MTWERREKEWSPGWKQAAWLPGKWKYKETKMLGGGGGGGVRKVSLLPLLLL